MNVAVGARTDTGRVREGNEDSYLAEPPLFAVADGMGGHLAGDVASATAVEVIRKERKDLSPDDPDSLAAMLQHANEAIWDRAQSDPGLRGMGTTCTLALVDEQVAQLAHVGDSRAYLLRDGQLTQVTQDHTLVGRMVSEGRLSPEDAEHHPQRSIITRALGVDANVDIDVMTLELAEGDRLLLCSDGLSAMVGADAIRGVLESLADPQQAADELVDSANEAGGEDNVTVVVIDVGRDGTGAAPPPVPEGQTGPITRGDTDPATDTDYQRAVEVPPGPGKRRWLRTLVLAAIALLILGGGGIAAARYALSNSWFVGVDDAGLVTIYRGIPDDVAGVSLRETHHRSDVRLASLPDFKRDEVASGITVDSLEEAERTVADLELLSADRDFETRTNQKKGDQ